jgi:acyl carrier protein
MEGIMNTINDFMALIRDELGLPVTAEDATREFDMISGWDSTYMLWLVAILEQKTGRRITVIDILEAPNLEHVFDLVARPSSSQELADA